MRDRRIARLIDRDSMQEFQQETGRSYKDPAVQGEVLGRFLVDNVQKNAALRATGDTVWSHDYADYLAKVESLGFETVWQRHTWNVYAGYGPRVVGEVRMLFHPGHGVLFHLDGSADAGRAPIVNGANIAFNWRPRGKAQPRQASGGWEKDTQGRWVFAGTADVRTGMLFEWQEYLDNGEFVTPWIAPILSDPPCYVGRVNYDVRATHDFDKWKRAKRRRLLALPAQVLARIRLNEPPAVGA